MSETDGDRDPGGLGSPGALGALRDGWHSLGGGDAAACPGCPVCRLSESAGRMDPETAAHLQQALGHVVSAGRELLAALARPARSGPADGPRPDVAPGSTGGSAGAPTDRPTDPPTAPVRVRTRIPVDTPPTRPHRGNEEQA